MATNDIPVSTIKEQPLINTPTNSDATIMDDTVMTMNGAALMGGQVTIIDSIKSEISVVRVFTKIPRES